MLERLNRRGARKPNQRAGMFAPTACMMTLTAAPPVVASASPAFLLTGVVLITVFSQRSSASALLVIPAVPRGDVVEEAVLARKTVGCWIGAL